MSESQAAADPPEPQEPDPADPVTSVDAIRGQLAESERRYAASLERARQSEARVAQVTGQLQTVQQDRTALEFSTVSNALEAAKSQADSLQGQYAAAMEAGEFKRAGEIGVEIGRVGARIEQFEQAKQQMEAQRNEALRQPVRQEQVRQPQSDPAEAHLSTLDARSAAWIRQQKDSNGNLRFFSDLSFQNKVRGAHFDALGEGLTENSPDYFKFVEGRVNVSGSGNGGGNGAQQPQRGGVPPAAPVRNSGSYRDGQNRGGGHIPAEAVRVAKSMGLSKPEEIKAYWDESRRMARAGEFKSGDPFAGAV